MSHDNHKILALDLGEKYIGCAISNNHPHPIFSYPIPPVKVNLKQLTVASIRKLIQEHAPKKIIIGIPYLLDGTATPQTRRYKTFARKLKKVLSIEIELIDETLSTWEVKSKFKHLNLGKSDDSINIDSFSAMEMLNQYLENRP